MIRSYHGRLAIFFVASRLFLTAHARSSEPQSFFLYVSNEHSNDISIIDGKTNMVVATLPVGKRPRGIHASPDGNRLYVVTTGSARMAPGVDAERAPADKTADGMTVIDTASRRVIDRWHIGSDPEQFALTRDGKLAVVANEDDASVSLVDLSDGQTQGKIKVSEEPEGVGVNPRTGDVYVTCEEKGEVLAISPSERRVLATMEVGARPRSIAFTADGARAFVACENATGLSVIDTSSNKVVSRIPLPEGSLPMGTVMSPNSNELYVSTGRGRKVAVIDLAKNEVAAMIPVGPRVWGIALSPDGTRLYTANGPSNDVSVIDVKSRQETTRIKVGDGPWGVTVALGP